MAEIKDRFPSWIDSIGYTVPVPLEEEKHQHEFQKDFDTDSMEFISMMQKERYKVTNGHEVLSKKPQ